MLAYLPVDQKVAEQIAGILGHYGIQIKLVQDDPENRTAFSDTEDTEPLRLMRLWTRNAAEYWKTRSAQSDWHGGQGLLLRIEANVALPEGLVPAQVFDLSDLEKGLNQETAARLLEAVQGFLENPETEPQSETIPEGYSPREWAEIQGLLDEINNPATEPPRRLAIGDRLAELGDPRPGVGVREIRVPLGRGISEAQPEPQFSSEIQAYLDEINDIKTEPPRRLQIGNELARLGDPRKGVGLEAKGLPDIDWVEIPGGSFIYQSGQMLELPTFCIARFPVTNAQFQAFVDAGGYQNARWWRDLRKPESAASHGPQANRPRTDVDWYEAVAFCRWFSAMIGLARDMIRLPNEQEWEKAARGEQDMVYPWGNQYRPGIANINEKYNETGPWYLEQTTAVGLYPQGCSPYGVTDLSGNVWEWCLNKYKNHQVSTPVTSGTQRVLRGGSWFDDADSARSVYRDSLFPQDRYHNRGFRVLSSVPIR